MAIGSDSAADRGCDSTRPAVRQGPAAHARIELPEQYRLAERLKVGGKGLPDFTWGPDAKTLSVEQRAAVMNFILNAEDAEGLVKAPVAEPPLSKTAETVSIPLADLLLVNRALHGLAAIGRSDPMEWHAMSTLRRTVKALTDTITIQVRQALPPAFRDKVDHDLTQHPTPAARSDPAHVDTGAQDKRESRIVATAERGARGVWRPPAAIRPAGEQSLTGGPASEPKRAAAAGNSARNDWHDTGRDGRSGPTPEEAAEDVASRILSTMAKDAGPGANRPQPGLTRGIAGRERGVVQTSEGSRDWAASGPSATASGARGAPPVTRRDRAQSWRPDGPATG